MLKVKPLVKLPLETLAGKGSYTQRLNYARQLNSRFFEEIKPKIKNNGITFSDYKEVLTNILPTKIKFNVVKLSKNLAKQGIGGMLIVNGSLDNDIAESMTIMLPLSEAYDSKENKKYKYISRKHFGTVAHENLHFFLRISNPKHISRSDFANDKDEDFYNKNLYKSEPLYYFGIFEIKFIRKLFKFLKNKDLEQRINFLQTCRLQLEEEKLAFIEEEKFGQYNRFIDFYHFNEKLSILEIFLYQNLKKARKLIKKNSGK